MYNEKYAHKHILFLLWGGHLLFSFDYMLCLCGLSSSFPLSNLEEEFSVDNCLSIYNFKIKLTKANQSILIVYYLQTIMLNYLMRLSGKKIANPQLKRFKYSYMYKIYPEWTVCSVLIYTAWVRKQPCHFEYVSTFLKIAWS